MSTGDPPPVVIVHAGSAGRHEPYVVGHDSLENARRVWERSATDLDEWAGVYVLADKMTGEVVRLLRLLANELEKGQP